MKKLITIAVLSFLAGFGIGLVRHYQQPPAPPAINVTMPNGQIIKTQYQQERRDFEHRRKVVRAIMEAKIVYRTNGCSTQFAEITAMTALDYGINPRLLAAVVVAESSANPNAVSKGRDIGLMQINTKVWKHTRAELQDPVRNLHIGTRILVNCIHKYGVVEGLHHYNGIGNPDNTYAEAVLAKAGLKG